MNTYLTFSIVINLALVYGIIRLYFSRMLIRSEFILFSDWSYNKIKCMADSAKWQITDLVASGRGQKNDGVRYEENLGEVSYEILNAEKDWFEAKENFQLKFEKNGIRRLTDDDKYYFIDAEVFSTNPFKKFFTKKFK